MNEAIERAREAAAEASWSQNLAIYHCGPEWGDRKEIMKDEWRRISNAAIDAFLPSLKASGYVVVPEVATDMMEIAGMDIYSKRKAGEFKTPKQVWSAMIAAHKGG